MALDLYKESLASDRIYQDLQKIIRVGLYSFRIKQLGVLPEVAGYPRDSENRVIRGAIRRLVEEQISFLPNEEWQEFAERLFGFTGDTSNQPASVREQLAGEGLEKPRQPSSVRAEGGIRQAVVVMLAQQISDWADHDNPSWHDSLPPIDFI